MVIQQGRLTENKQNMGKQDLLNMVRYGAEMVFDGRGGNITDEDIDAIIRKVQYRYQLLQTCLLCTSTAVEESDHLLAPLDT